MRKRQIFSIIIIGCVFNLMFFCNICVNAASNPYPGNMNSNCTYAAWQKTKDIMGIELPPWGNAWSWYSSAQSAGYSVGTTPKANSIVVFKQAAWNGNYGHVAFVSDYNSATGQIYKMEGNYNGTYHEGWAPAWESDMYGYVYLTQQDKSAPSISNIKIVNRTSNGYDVTCTITDNVGVVRWEFPTWKVSRTSAGCKWYPGWRNGDTYGFTFSDADLEGDYLTHIYAWDAAGNVSSASAPVVCVDKTKPQISNVKVSDLTSAGYTVSCTVTDEGGSGINRVEFPTWTVRNDQDDLANPWERGSISGSTVTYRVNVSSHNSESGQYVTHIYASDECGNVSSYAIPVITVPPDISTTTGYDRTIPDGDYLIANAGTTDKTAFYYLDIEGTEKPAKDNTNVSLCGPLTNEPPSYEIWTLKYSNGFYKITQKDTSMALDVSNASTEKGANVMVYPSHDCDNQKWAISTNGKNGYRIQSKCNGFSLDVKGGGTINGTNVRMWSNNSSDAQSWLFIPYKPKQPIENGRYVLLSTLDESLELDVSGDTGDIGENTNVQIWKDTAPSKYNSFDITKLDNGYYKIIHSASGKALDLSGGGSGYSANVVVHTQNGSIAQQWAITKSGNNCYLRVKCSGFALDVESGKKANGTNVSQYPFNGNDLQMNQAWKFVPAEYKVSYDANGGNGVPSAETKYYKTNLKISSDQPKRTDYIFNNWNTKRDGSGISYNPGDVFSEDENTVLYAQWKTASDSHSHELISIKANTATCTEDGNSAYWTCSGCKKYFSDANGTKEITENSWVIKAKGHDLIHTDAKTETETQDGNKEYWTCSVCKKYFSDANGKIEIDKTDWFIPATNHVHELIVVAKKDATCTELGNIAYWICGCGKCFSDAQGKNEIEKSTVIIRANGHDPEIIPAVEPTCTETGLTAGIKCSVCGTIQKAQEVIPAKGHTVVTDPAVPATETSTGLTAGSHCSVCGKVFVAQEVIPKKSSGGQGNNGQETTKQGKSPQPMTVKVAKRKTVKASKIKKKKQGISPITVKSARGTVKYKITGGKKKYRKVLKINAKTGMITVKKKTKKGTYKVKVTVTASGNRQYKSGSKTVTVKVVVK